ncbi:hypothetical protein JL720_1685 [Aureococcus anophagefferens]|nr:hypothetical protein JL720_1685 [Aureococcus anophagefferens]
MAASDKRGLVENVKTLRRRLSLFGRTAFGKRVPPEVVDGEMEARRAEFADMLGGVDELGAGLAEHVAVLRAYFANSEALAGSPDLAAVEAGTRLARERWAYLNAVVRRSAAGVLVECCLDPLRTLATATKRTVTGALASYDARRADYAHFLKRGPPKDAPDALDRARADYDLARRAALDAIAAALDEYRELVGGPRSRRGAEPAGRALAVLTGKRELADLKREAADLEDRRRLQADQARRSWDAESPKTHDSLGGGARRLGHRQREAAAAAGAAAGAADGGGLRAPEPAARQVVAALRRAAANAGRRRPAGFRVVALFDCAADEDGELALAKGDVVTRAPAKSVRLSRGPSGAPPTPPDAPNRVVVALFDCVGDDDGELSFAAGALITVVDASDDGWWTGDADGKRGVFPANYVKAAA